MCTAITYKTDKFYVGRNLDYEFDYGQKILITPRNKVLPFNHADKSEKHYAIIGMGIEENGFPLYFDAVNEKGLAVAGLNFVGNAFYSSIKENKLNLAQFEFVPYILASCANIKEVKKILSKLNIDNESFSEKYPPSQLHWLIADKNECITVESLKDGLHVYENIPGVLTNNPPFEMQMFNLNNYMSLSNQNPTNKFSEKLNLNTYSRGMGAIGLPGDLSSSSRFVKCCFTKLNSRNKADEISSISQFFHILTSVEQQMGCCEVKKGEYEYTIYSSCMNCDEGIYYYTTYFNHRINAINMFDFDLEGSQIYQKEIINTEDINYQK